MIFNIFGSKEGIDTCQEYGQQVPIITCTPISAQLTKPATKQFNEDHETLLGDSDKDNKLELRKGTWNKTAKHEKPEWHLIQPVSPDPDAMQAVLAY